MPEVNLPITILKMSSSCLLSPLFVFSMTGWKGPATVLRGYHLHKTLSVHFQHLYSETILFWCKIKWNSRSHWKSLGKNEMLSELFLFSCVYLSAWNPLYYFAFTHYCHAPRWNTRLLRWEMKWNGPFQWNVFKWYTLVPLYCVR